MNEAICLSAAQQHPKWTSCLSKANNSANHTVQQSSHRIDFLLLRNKAVFSLQIPLALICSSEHRGRPRLEAGENKVTRAVLRAPSMVDSPLPHAKCKAVMLKCLGERSTGVSAERATGQGHNRQHPSREDQWNQRGWWGDWLQSPTLPGGIH